LSSIAPESRCGSQRRTYFCNPAILIIKINFLKVPLTFYFQKIDFRVCSAYGAANPKINFLKVESKRHFQKIDFYNENCWITKVGAALRAAPTFWSDRTQVNIKLT